jgi:parvulin-like peptidyl-prolyl isomerase
MATRRRFGNLRPRRILIPLLAVTAIHWIAAFGERLDALPSARAAEATPPPDSSSHKHPTPPTGFPDHIVALVNGVPITKKDFDLSVSQHESMNPQRFQAMTPAERERALSRILDRMIVVRLQTQEARRLKIEVPDELVEQEYEAFYATFPSEKDMLKALEQGKTNPTLWKKSMHDHLLIRKLEQSMATKLVVSDQEVQRYWNENRNALQGDQYHVRHILVRTEKEAQQVVAALKNESFEAAVKKYSVDHLTRTKGGDLGWVSRGEISPEFEQAIASLKPQQVSRPIKGRYGYHIVQVLEKKTAAETSLPDYQEKIRSVIRAQKWGDRRDAWLQDLRANATILTRPPETGVTDSP